MSLTPAVRHFEKPFLFLLKKMLSLTEVDLIFYFGVKSLPKLEKSVRGITRFVREPVEQL